MANLVLFFALLCFQISRGEGVSKSDTFYGEGKQHVMQFPGKDGVEFEGTNEGKSAEGGWTEEDEKWFEEIQNLLAEDSDEDYDISDVEFGKLIQEIEKLVVEHHPEKGNYEWLQEIAKWFYAADDYDDDWDAEVDEELSDFYSWVYHKNIKTGAVRINSEALSGKTKTL